MNGTNRVAFHPLLHNNTHHFTKESKAKIHTKGFQDQMSSKSKQKYNPQILRKIQEAKTKPKYLEADKRFNIQELQNGIKNLKTKKTCGTDDIPNEFIQKLPEIKQKELLGIYNRSWRTGKIPEKWKTGVIIPILKPGKNPEIQSSYRPITLLQCLGKLMENMVGARLNFLAESHNILPDTQHGFRLGRNTIDPILGLEKEIRTSLVQKKVTILVFFDLKAAFDSVDHTLLLHTLATKGIGGKMLTWLEDFLMGRKICVQLEDYISESVCINRGVPQGSGISPILFIMLLTTLPKIDPVKSEEFADDVCYSMTSGNIGECEFLLQPAINRFLEWAEKTGLTINASKTKSMLFTLQKGEHSEGLDTNLEINGEKILEVYTFRYLGVLLDAPYLKWGPHTEALKSQCQHALNIMKALAATNFGADRESLLQIYNALIKSRIAYSSALLVSASQPSIDKLEIIQNTAIRIAAGALRSSPIASLQCETNLPPLALYIQMLAVRTYLKIKRKGTKHPIIRHTKENEPQNLPWTKILVKPFTLQVEQIMHDWGLTIEQQIPKLEYPVIPPWEKLEEYISLDLLDNETKADSIPILKAAALKTIVTKYPDCLHIYTDGSKKDGNHHNINSTTAAFYVPKQHNHNHDHSEKWKLHPAISIAGAEMSAIYKATEWLFLSTIPKGKVVILTDSKVSLHLLLQRKPKSYAHSVTEVQNNIRLLRYTGWEIYLQWIPSHCGVQGNRVADTQADEAHELTDVDVYPLEYDEHVIRLRTAFKNRWSQHWNDKKANSVLGRMRDDLGPWPHSRHKYRPLDVALTRLRLGSTKLNNHMNTLRLADSPLCTRCNAGARETRRHFLLECEAYNQQRLILMQNLAQMGVIAPTIDMLLGKSDVTEDTKIRITMETAHFILKTNRLEDI